MQYSSNCFNGMTFSFDVVSSDMYGLYMAWRTANDEWDTGLSREIIKSETNMIRHVPNLYGTKFTETIVHEFDIFHKDQSPFDYRESLAINNWLIKDTYKRFKVNDNNVDNIYYKAICTAIQDITMGDFYGKHIVMTCDSPYGYMPEVKKIINLSESGEETFRLKNGSDDGAYYPYITISCDGNYTGTVEFYNETENKTMTVDMSKIASKDEKKTVNINCEKMIVTDADNTLLPLYKLGWRVTPDPSKALQSSELYWFRFLTGINKVTVRGNAKVIFRMNYRKKAGVMDEQQNLSM